MNTEPMTSLEQEGTKECAVGTRKIRFFLMDPYAEQVCIAGSFNNWNPTATLMVPEGRGRWISELTLPIGRHEYQFVIDGHWKPDRAAKETVFNPFGGVNSVITVAPDNGNGKK